MDRWKDLVDFEVTPIVTSQEAAATILASLTTSASGGTANRP
jgi:hypothetical protein